MLLILTNESALIQRRLGQLHYNKSFLLKKWANPGLFFIYFRSFQTNNTIFTTKQCEKNMSTIWSRDSNPQPYKHESSPINTRPGLPPQDQLFRSFDPMFGFLLSFTVSRFQSSLQKKLGLSDVSFDIEPFYSIEKFRIQSLFA